MINPKNHEGREPLSCVAMILALVLTLPLSAGCSSQVEQSLEGGRTQAEQTGEETVSDSRGSTKQFEVTRIVDGDTIEVSPDAAAGNPDVRFLGVDTPETYGDTEPLGREAKDFTARQLEDKRVTLEYDEDLVDPYDRALAHVSVVGEDRTIQEQLLSRGLAQTAFFKPNDLHKNRLLSIQEEARRREAGIWGLPVSEQCELADRGNGIGEGASGCS